MRYPDAKRGSRMAIGILGGFLMISAACPALGSNGQPQTLLGLPLQQALHELESRGLRLVYTTRLVRPDMRVLEEPRADEPRLVLDEILASHGLQAEERAGGVLVIVEAPEPSVRPTEASDPGDRALPLVEDEIVVQPSRFSLLLEEPDVPFSWSREDMENLPHLGRDVFRALSMLPGTTSNDLSAQPHVRGGRTDEVQILLDGQELYQAYHLQDFDSALSAVVSEGLDSVRLSTGAFPASHGDRMGAVLDMRTMSPSEPLRTQLSLSLVDASAQNSGTFRNRRGGWLTSARRGFVDFAGRALGDEDPVFWDVFAKVESRLGSRHHLRAHLLRAGDRLDFGEVVEGDAKTFDTRYDTGYLWLTHQAVFTDDLFVETAGSGSRVERDRLGGEAAEEETFDVTDRRTFDVAGFKQDWTWQPASRHLLTWGGTVRSYDARYDYENRFEREEQDVVLDDPVVPVPRFEGRFRSEYLAAYVSDRFSPVAPLTLELGVRYDRHVLTDDTVASPRVNLAWRLGETQVVRAAWGHFFQSQRPYELQVEDGETTFFPAELSEHWVLGYERIFGPGRRSPVDALRIEAYRRNVDDPRPRFENLFESIVVFPEIEPDRVRIAPSRSWAEGVELMLRGSMGSKTDWWLNYAWSSAEDRLDGRDVPRKIDQPHALNVHLGHRFGPKWSLNVVWRFHSGWRTTPVSLLQLEPEEPEDEPEAMLVPGPLYSDQLSAHHRLDLRASRRWTKPWGELTFFVDVQNAYDRRNAAGFDFEIDDGDFFVEEESWPGVLPSVGLRWSF